MRGGRAWQFVATGPKNSCARAQFSRGTRLALARDMTTQCVRGSGRERGVTLVEVLILGEGPGGSSAPTTT